MTLDLLVDLVVTTFTVDEQMDLTLTSFTKGSTSTDTAGVHINSTISIIINILTLNSTLEDYSMMTMTLPVLTHSSGIEIILLITLVSLTIIPYIMIT